MIAELRLKARAAPGFPSHNTFQRFGTKQDLRERLRAHALAAGQQDVAALCGPPGRAEDAGSASSGVDATTLGDVYLIKSGKYFKIGRSNAAGRRERELAIQLPDRTTRVHTIRTDDPVGIEEYWHRRFADRRKNGEWFALTAADLAAFRRRRFM